MDGDAYVEILLKKEIFPCIFLSIKTISKMAEAWESAIERRRTHFSYEMCMKTLNLWAVTRKIKVNGYKGYTTNVHGLVWILIV